MPLRVSYHELDSPLGPLLLAASADGLAGIEFGLDYPAAARDKLEKRLRKRFRTDVELIGKNARLRPALDWLESYFTNPAASRIFSGPLDLGGTEFQQKVWMQMLKIPAGATLSYGQMAAAIGRPRAVRAVGNACGANPVPLIVPCHRVTAGGGIGGFGPGVALKRKMLAAEGFDIFREQWSVSNTSSYVRRTE